MKGFVLLVLLVSLVVLCFIQSTIAEEQGVQQEKLEVNNNKINIEEMDGLSKERREELGIHYFYTNLKYLIILIKIYRKKKRRIERKSTSI